MAGRFFLISLLLSFTLVTLQSASGDDVPIITLATDDLNEVVRNSALISGAIVVGVQVHQISEDEPSLVGYIPTDWRGSAVCAQVVSADGLYEGYGHYKVPDEWTSGRARFSFPTIYGDFLKATPRDGLGILVLKGKCGSENASAKTIALWNASDLETVDVVLNSFRADDVFAYVAKQDAPIRCSKIGIGGGTAFDTKCRIKTDSLSGQTQIDIYRVVEGKPSKPTKIDIWFPGG